MKNPCHQFRAPASADALIEKLLSLVECITRTTSDGRRVPSCEGGCVPGLDLTVVADFTVLRAAQNFLDGHRPAPGSAVRRRVADIVAGACGRQHAEEDDALCIDELGRVIPALQSTWPGLPDYVWFPHNLGRFTSVEDIADWLEEAGAK